MLSLSDGAALDYRAYIMDDAGHIADVELIQAVGDDAAWRSAIASNGGAAVELWCRDREIPHPTTI